jgi:hypothetical protein
MSPNSLGAVPEDAVTGSQTRKPFGRTTFPARRTGTDMRVASMPARGRIWTTLNSPQASTDQKIVPAVCPIRCMRTGGNRDIHGRETYTPAWVGSRRASQRDGLIRKSAIEPVLRFFDFGTPPGCAGCQDGASSSVALGDLGCTERFAGRPRVGDAGGAVRGDAGGVAAPAAGPAAERPAGRRPGACGAPVRRVHRLLAVAVDGGAGGVVAGLGCVGALDRPRLPGCAGHVPGLCLRSALWLGG